MDTKNPQIRQGTTKRGGRVLAALALALILALSLALIGCSAPTSSASASSASGSAQPASADNKVVLGYWGGTCEAPLYIAYQNGYFEEEGLTPELLQITGDVAPLMASDELDVFELTPDKFKPMEQGLEVYIIDSLHVGCIQGATLPDSGIKTPADLEGKKVAAPMGSIQQIEIASQMVLAGKDPNKVEWLTYPNAELEPALFSGEVDAFAQYDPWTDIAVKNGAVKFFSNTFDEGLNDTLCCFVGMSKRTLDERPELGPKVSAAIKKAAEFLENNPDEAADIIAQAGYVPIQTDSGFTRDIFAQEIKDYTWISGDRDVVDHSFYEIWMMINRAGAMEDAPKDQAELDKYIKETLYNKSVRFQG
ncbi:MAG: ABC transporter substrate-binding protein [Coriobacteriales bacterium]|jgi:NitT/TauT family transport system substrate-binding protein|nr:ABC transporter substrate-binding protein [Coriobacteriales bacterium]